MSKENPGTDPNNAGDGGTPLTGNDPGAGDGGNNGQDEVTFSAEQQAAIDKIIADRLKRQADKLKADAEAEKLKAQQDAEEARLAEEKKYQELADKRKAELEALRPQAETAQQERDSYRAALEAHVTELTKDLPEHITELLATLDPVKQLEYLTKHREDLDAGDAQTPGGPPKTPKPKGDGKLTDDEIRAQAWNLRRGL